MPVEGVSILANCCDATISLAVLDLPTMLIAVNHCFAGDYYHQGLFAEELLKALIASCPDDQFFIFTNHDLYHPEFELPQVNILRLPALRGKLPLSKTIWKRRLTREIRKVNATVFLQLSAQLVLNTGAAQVLLLDELAVGELAASRGWRKRQYLQNLRLSKKVAVPSLVEVEKLRHWEAADKYIAVGAGPELTALHADWQAREKQKEQYASGKEYFLLQAQPHSSELFVRILKAFSYFKKRQQSQLQLLIPDLVVEDIRDWKQKLATYKYRDDVKVLHQLAGIDVGELIASAYGLIDLAPHFHQSAAVLQAFECRTPLIIAKNSPAAIWTGPNAALMADAAAPESIATQMMLLYKDEHLRKRLITAGEELLLSYSWEVAAAKLQDGLQAFLQDS